jgi:hypothetical protein
MNALWVGKHESLFPTIMFVACQILGIMGSYIETKRIFSLIKEFTNLNRSCLQLENLDKLIFVNTNWSNDPKVGCTSPSSLI